jgi:hypothetical protein
MIDYSFLEIRIVFPSTQLNVELLIERDQLRPPFEKNTGIQQVNFYLFEVHFDLCVI